MTSDIESRAAEEKRKMEQLLKKQHVSKERLKVLEPAIENTAWMKVKLDDTRAAIRNSQVVIKGDKGLEENPLFKGYEALWKAYLTGMSKIFRRFGGVSN